MSLNSRSSSRSFVSRYLLAPRTTAAAVLALGLGIAASSARADEPAPAAAPEAQVSESPAAPPAANIARPLTMRDLGTSSSIGLRAEGSYVSLDFFDTTVHAYSGSLIFDGELALTDNVKVFASFPLTGIEAAESGSDSGSNGVAGHGNLTLGAQVQGGNESFQAAFGGTYSDFGDDDGSAGVYTHLDLPAFATGAAVVRGFGTVRGGTADGFIQAELSYMNGIEDGETGDGVGQAKLGAGTRVDESRMFHSEIGVLTNLDNEHSSNLYVADIGLRGAMGAGSSGSWGAQLTFAHGEGMTTFGVGFDWRTDLPGLSGK